MPVPNGLDEISRRFERRPRPPLPARPRHAVDRPDPPSSESASTAPDRGQPAVAEPSIDLPAAQGGMQAPSKPIPVPPLVARLEPDRRPRLSPLDPTVNLGLRIRTLQVIPKLQQVAFVIANRMRRCIALVAEVVEVAGEKVIHSGDLWSVVRCQLSVISCQFSV